MSRYVSATSTASMREMSAITRSGASVWSTVMKWCSGSSASSFPRKKRSTPHSRIVATPRTLERMADAYKAGSSTSGAGRFFEAHEELELAWRAAAAEERDFYQGLVHVAVAWYQAGRGRPVATASQLEKARRRLAAFDAEPSRRRRRLRPRAGGAGAGDVAGGSLELDPPHL